MNVGIESVSSTKALNMTADSFITNFVKMEFMSSRRTENNYKKIFRYVYIIFRCENTLRGDNVILSLLSMNKENKLALNVGRRI
jgi:hypothetical protein